MTGILEAIHVTDAAGAPMRSLPRAALRAGVGIATDRYATSTGEWSEHPAGHRELTLVAGEVVDEMGLSPGTTRRNLTTRGVDLDSLIGREFTIGVVRCRGERACEPCAYLEGLIGRPILRDLVHRGGLRASILDHGEIMLGDPIRVIP